MSDNISCTPSYATWLDQAASEFAHSAWARDRINKFMVALRAEELLIFGPKFPRKEVIDGMIADLVRGGYLKPGEPLPDSLPIQAIFHLLNETDEALKPWRNEMGGGLFSLEDKAVN